MYNFVLPLWRVFYKWCNLVCIVKQFAFLLNAIFWTLSMSAPRDLTLYFKLLQGVLQCGPWEGFPPIS